MTDLTNKNIWERRFEAAIERFGSFDECMEIPGYGLEPEYPVPTEYQNKLEKRFEACKQRYQGMEEYMDIPDMDLWLSLKNEIVVRKRPKLPILERNVCQTFYTLDQLHEMNVIKKPIHECQTLYTLDEIHTSDDFDHESDFDPYIDEFQTVSMQMKSSEYNDYYEPDYDNYSMDSMDKEEHRYLIFKDKCLEGRRGRGRGGSF